MSRLNVVRAWKDEEYRLALSAAERALLPDDPAGAIELTDADLGGVAGGMPPTCEDDSCYNCTLYCTLAFTCEYTCPVWCIQVYTDLPC
jgi:mersacidin/lichenicidin family type 2 lantibiotic